MADNPIEVYLAASSGLNTEDSPLNASPNNAGHSEYEGGSYLYALNARIGNSFGVNAGAVENIPSTLSISSFLEWNGSAWVTIGPQPAGPNVAVGKYEDHTEGKVYWFVKNAVGADAIMMFVKSERKIYQLIRWGFNFGKYVSATKINKFLIFTDGNPSDGTGNPPRIIDVTTIYSLRYTLGTNFSEYHISFVKWAPLLPPLIQVQGQADGSVFMKKGIFQFSFRYVYKGGFKSCFAPPSNFATNEQLVLVNPNGPFSGSHPSPLIGTAKNFGIYVLGFLFDSNTPANTAFNHTDPKFYYFVESIEYAYRESTSANWKIFNRVAVNDAIPPSTQTFANAGPAFNVADNEIGQYFDAVPLLSRAVEAIDNRPMFGNNLDDLPPMLDFDVTNIEVYSVQPTEDNWYNLPAFPALTENFLYQKFSFKENGIYKLGIIGKNLSGRSGLVQTLDKWSYTIPVNTDNDPQAQEDFHALGFKIPDSVIPAEWMNDYQIVRSNCLNIEMFIIGIVNDYKFLTIDLPEVKSDNSSGVTDSIRSTISGFYDSSLTGGAQYSLISRIISAVRKNKEVALAQCTLIYMDITNWVLDTNQIGSTIPFVAPSNSVYYNWIPGDRVRFWSNNAFDYSGVWTQHDEEIIEYTGTGLLVSRPVNLGQIQNRRTIGASVNGPNKTYTIDVYRPKKYSTQNDVIFYEMGELYPVLEPGTANRAFSKKDFTWSGQASVALSTVAGHNIYSKLPVYNGDVWLVTKNFFYTTGTSSLTLDDLVVGRGFLGPFVSALGFFVINDYPVFPQMTQDRTNAAGIWEHNNGRPLVAYRYLPKQFNKSTQIRFGGKFLEDSLFIGINNFQEGSQFIYPGEYGSIRALTNVSNVVVKSVGNILLVSGEEESWSVYVNRTTLEDLSGRSQVSLSDKVLGSFNTLLGSYGTLNPESFSRKNSRVIFWSAKQGKWIRYSDDGLTPISDVKMYNWFNDLSILLINQYGTSENPKALTVFDNYYGEWITILNHSSLPSTYRGYSSYRCVSFSEDSKRWKSFYDYAPEFFAALENETYSIIGLNIHIHFAGADFGSIYGVKKDTMWQPIANQEFRRKKIWVAIAEEATDKWSLPSIDGDFKSNGALIQTTALQLTDLTNLEDVFWSAIKRDTNTPNKTGDDALNNGNVMRSKTLTLMLKLDPVVTWYSFLNWLMVSYTVSEKTLKK